MSVSNIFWQNKKSRTAKLVCCVQSGQKKTPLKQQQCDKSFKNLCFPALYGSRKLVKPCCILLITWSVHPDGEFRNTFHGKWKKTWQGRFSKKRRGVQIEMKSTPLLLSLSTALELLVLLKLERMSQGCVFGDLHPGDNDRPSLQ